MRSICSFWRRFIGHGDPAGAEEMTSTNEVFRLNVTHIPELRRVAPTGGNAMNRSLRLRPSPSSWVLLAVALATFALTPTLARAQLSGSTSSNAGSTCTPNSADRFCGSSTSTLINTGATFQSRYAWNVNADIGIFSTSDSSGGAQHNMAFSATAPGGYRLDIATQRTGDVNRVNDASGCDGSAQVNGVSGSSNFALSSGNLNLADPADLGNGGSTTSTPFNNTGSAVLFRVSNGVAQNHSLTFTWSGSARSNSCEAAVRIGQNNGSTTGCGACEYPGSPSRTQANDGHFVTVTYTSLCGNSVVDGSVSEQCDQGAANGTASSCCTSTCQFKNSSNQCRAAGGDCDPADFCTGSSGTCPANVFSSSGVCRPSAGDCDIAESCNGSGPNCPANGFKSSSVECRGSAGDCDVAENCTGSTATCPADGFLSASTECRGSAGDCDIAENCTGSSAACPADDLVDAGTECRGNAGPCDIAEACTGSSPACPADAFQAAPANQASGATATQSSTDVGTADLAIDGDTDGDFANGSVSRTNAETEASWEVDLGAVEGINTIEIWNTDDGTEGNLSAFYVFVSDNPFTGTTVDDSLNQAGVSAYYTPGQAARPSTIDVSRTGQYVRVQLTGGDALTLAEVRILTGTVCRNGVDECDADDLCDGSGAACASPDAKETVECRAAAGVCDVSETCDGINDACPTDDFVAAATECRASAGDCDVAESCTGSDADCPVDAFEPATTECRAAVDFCDAAENCTGSDADCPADVIASAGTECRPQNGACDVAEECDGVSTACPADGVADTSTTCRGLQGTCDVAENCDGVTTLCPADVVLPNLSLCRASAGDCDPQETCDGTSPACPSDTLSSSSTVCRPATGDCDVADSCTGSSATCPADVVAPSTQVCRGAADQCDLVENCDGSTKLCPADLISPDGDSDGDCDLIDNCISDPNANQADADNDGDGDVCDPCTNTGNSFATRRKITVKKILAPAGDDKLVIKGRVTLPSTPTINPLANGVRVILETAAPDQMFDITVPGDPYNPLTRTGWRVSASGTRWTYKNASPTPADPISTVKVVQGNGGVYTITVKGKNGDLPVAIGDVPLKGTVVIDQPTAETGQCGEWTFPSSTSCRFAGSFNSVTCK
jgi:hypothetical protein